MDLGVSPRYPHTDSDEQWHPQSIINQTGLLPQSFTFPHCCPGLSCELCEGRFGVLNIIVSDVCIMGLCTHTLMLSWHRGESKPLLLWATYQQLGVFIIVLGSILGPVKSYLSLLFGQEDPGLRAEVLAGFCSSGCFAFVLAAQLTSKDSLLQLCSILQL